MKEGPLLQAGFDEEKLEKVVVHESEDGDDDAKIIQKIGNEANAHYEDKNLELMAPLNRLKCLINNGKVGSSEDRDINSIAFLDQKDDQEEQVERAKSKVGIMREENERLKTLLGRAMKQYESLRMHLLAILQQQEASKWKDVDHDREPEVHVALSLGRNSSARNDEPRKEEAICSTHSSKLFKLKEEIMDLKENDHNLALTLNNCKPEVESQDDEPRPSITAEPVLSLDDCNIDEQETTKEEVAGEPSPPRTKSLSKTVRSHEDDEVSQPALVKKARVSVRARCDAPTMNDGCQWRKYGQKIAKGNPCPRAYYRCTLAPACPVRKQVQRCAEDRSILITTYEGTHNHPLPVAATAMASTTSAAAFMLTSSSSNSSSPSFPTSSNTTASANLHGLLNFSSNNNSSGINIPNYNSRPTYFFHSSSPNYSSISPSLPHNSHPTITLDLTATAPSSLLFSSTTSQSNYVGKSSSSSSTFSITPRTSYCFYSSAPNHHNNTISLQPASLGPDGYHNNDNHIYHGYYRYKNNMNPINDRPEQPLISTETIAAATKAIASDPSFRSVLAAAITSTIVGADAGTGSSTVLGKNSSAISTAPSGNRIQCTTSLSNRSPSFSSSTLRPDQQASFTRLPSSLSFSSPENKAATSPTEH